MLNIGNAVITGSGNTMMAFNIWHRASLQTFNTM
jgi:hypothetical protein